MRASAPGSLSGCTGNNAFIECTLRREVIDTEHGIDGRVVLVEHQLVKHHAGVARAVVTSFIPVSFSKAALASSEIENESCVKP